ncbi:hypothetical protein [Tropicimonas marinistellae]|uniref:hypothetical protein n=1 Tax=Tropicimonas marinistellae TaxID=1739787 RepID=UPI00082A4DC8|nr:hypothetical protein [Tropicimonas marinistellae]
MSDLTTTTTGSAPGFGDILGGRLRLIAEAVGTIRLGIRLQREYDALSRLSDAELERRGLSRETLVRHVYSEIL